MFDFTKEIQKYGISIENYELALDDIAKKVNKEIDLDWIEIRDKYSINCNPDTLRKSSTGIFGTVFVMEYIMQKQEKEKVISCEEAQRKYKTETSFNKDGSYTSDKLIVIRDEDLKNPAFLLKAHGFDIRDWELVSARNNIWNVHSKQDGIHELYSSKITVRPRTDISIEEVRDFYIELSNSYVPYERKYTHTSTKDGLMLEVPIFDLHLGKFSTVESSAGTYSTDIARECFNYVIDSVIEKTRDKNIEKIIFPVGSDFFNYDTTTGTTTGGTPQDNDRKSQQLFKDGVLLLIDGITKLSDVAPVEVFYVPGNHDFMTSYHAIMSLWCFFNKDEKVTVNADFSPRQYISFGKCLIGFSHGDKEKKRISGLMQIEVPHLWGGSIFREFHLGHLHSEHTKEENGVIIRNLSSVTSSDDWHHNSGYCGAVRKCTCFLWDKECGIDSTFNVVIK